ASFFYEDRYPALDMTAINYVTDDPKMSAYSGHTMEAKLGVLGEEFGLTGNWAGARFEGIIEYIIQHNRFGDAVVAHVALTLPFSYYRLALRVQRRRLRLARLGRVRARRVERSGHADVRRSDGQCEQRLPGQRCADGRRQPDGQRHPDAGLGLGLRGRRP